MLNKLRTITQNFIILQSKWPDLCYMCKEELQGVDVLVDAGDYKAVTRYVEGLSARQQHWRTRCLNAEYAYDRVREDANLQLQQFATTIGEEIAQTQSKFEQPIEVCNKRLACLGRKLQFVQHQILLDRSGIDILNQKIESQKAGHEDQVVKIKRQYEVTINQLKNDLAENQAANEKLTNERDNAYATVASLKATIQRLDPQKVQECEVQLGIARCEIAKLQNRVLEIQRKNASLYNKHPI